MKYLKYFYWLITSQFGIKPLTFINSIRALPAYIVDYFKFRKIYNGKLGIKPCLSDKFEAGGSINTEYFVQDLFVAKLIFNARPIKHVDVGSRVDGFVAHVASFREVEVFDVRAIENKIEGIEFKQVDFMNSTRVLELSSENGYTDSISCLHTLEHFGLGRYGDPIHQAGYEVGIENLATMLSHMGTAYLSVPIGMQRVEFNANWVFDPETILSCCREFGLVPVESYFINRKLEVVAINFGEEEAESLRLAEYNLGIFVLRKEYAGRS